MTQHISPDGYQTPMEAALAEAKLAAEDGDVPVGAVLLDEAGNIVASDHNRREQRNDPTAHAELLVLRARSQEVNEWRLNGHTLVVTLEPCAMCAGASVLARLDRIVYGAADPKAGAVWSLYNIPQDRRLNHRVDVIEGVLRERCSGILTDYFESRR